MTLLLGVGVVLDAALNPDGGWAGTWVGAVIGAAGAVLAATAVFERTALAQSPRWPAQALLGVAWMLALMWQGGPAGALAALLPPPFLLGTALARIQPARWRARAPRLVLDSALVALGITLLVEMLIPASSLTRLLGSVLIGSYAAGCYALAVSMRAAARSAAKGPDVWALAAGGLMSLFATGQVARWLELPGVSLLGTFGVALAASASLAASALSAQRTAATTNPAEAPEDSRLRLVPAIPASLVIVLISIAEVQGRGTQVGFFGLIALFGLIVARLFLALLHNRQLLRDVERAGAFEDELGGLGPSLAAALDRGEALDVVVRMARSAFRADAVLLWMLDPTTQELEAVEVLGPKRQHLLHRRMPLDDPESLAGRVARRNEAEIVTHAQTAGGTSKFLSVLLHAQALLAVPISRGESVQGVLVCVDVQHPLGYGARDLAKARLLAGQVAVVLDNAYQHELQRRRLEEVTALYQFAQSAHTAISPNEISRQLLPILKARLRYTYAAVWLRDPATGSLRLAAGDGPGGVPLAGLRPSDLATRAFSTSMPAHPGLGWSTEPDYVPPRTGVRSQLAVPLMVKRHVVGVVDLESKQANAYSLNDERLLVSLANHAALVIENLHLVGEARKVVAYRELDQMKSDLLSTVSHELRTPLGSIKGYASTLIEHDGKLQADERREFLEIIDSEADRLRELIENLLDLSRIEAGVMRIDPAPVQLGGVASEVVRKAQLAAPGHEFVLDWPEDPEIGADPRRVYQVLQNLVSNAVKYSPKGGCISVALVTSPRELTIVVSDEGLGIPSGELARVFDRFHRVGGDHARTIGGTGLGLAICKALVEAHGGRIWAESEGPNRGSRFIFSLPRNAARQAAPTHRRTHA